MNTKTILVSALVVLVAGAGIYLWPQLVSAPEQKNTNNSLMLAEKNAVVVNEQRPSKTITVAQVHLAAPSYVVIHEESDGEVGAILGASALLQAGTHERVVVHLSRAAQDGETLYAMLHAKSSGDGSFNATVDIPVESILGGPIMGFFGISSGAEENVEVTL